MKNINQGAGAAAFIGQILAYPFLIALSLQITWHFQIIALLLMGVCLAAAMVVKRYPLVLIIAAITGIIGAINQWILLPLVAVQLLLTFLLRTQKVTKQWAGTIAFGQAILFQILLIYAGLHFLSQDMLLDLALLYVPALIGLWANHFPKWTDMVLLAITVVIGYWLQRLNLIAIGGIVILVTLINSRRPFKVPSYLYQFSPVITTLLLYLARMHG
ncbi:hypothetical protein Lpp125_12436 [Lacticaseibacillus paracasei subsp. paracasei Lpp125]|uniref:hypothetical protein n=1 Tax=Lacticaseibacillus paracasei TaxID=1597 RepID=UPI00034362CB|nr:hypothetical protein [Lacticaseibacillus paracasei]EPC99553.1 hypothetical protein Lpp125_12436 [Lacticaseibacillus paracasei subsp. paracasei Lpp125]